MNLDEFELCTDYQCIILPQENIYACHDTHNAQYYSVLAWAW